MSLIPLPWRLLAMLALAASLFGAGLTVGLRHGQLQLDAYQGQQAQAALQAAIKAGERTRELQRQKDEAIHAATLRAQENARAAAAARTELGGLRDQLAAAQRRLPDAPRAAADQYTAAVSELFDQCAASYSGLAEKADGHASDVRTLMGAWPE